MEILALKDLSFRYPTEEKDTLSHVSLAIEEGEFCVLCGGSGCGKTTLMKLIKRELAPHGALSGEIRFCGKKQSELSSRESAAGIGYVLQNPEAQVITDKVWHELSFGLENLGYDADFIRLRIGEMANYFGIAHIFREGTAHLSGGQKQLLSLAAVMAMSPKLLLLDEPTSQLDPIAASDFIATLKKINRELGTTVIIAEHRLEELFPIADKVAFMEQGTLLSFGTPREVCRELAAHKISLGFPTAARIWQKLGGGGEAPLTVREGRKFLAEFCAKNAPISQKNDKEKTETSKKTLGGTPALTLSGVYFRYEKNTPDILRGATLDLREGEFFCLLGANGAGKTTVLRASAGLLKPYRGKVQTHGKRAVMLPQNVQNVFIKNTVREDIEDMLATRGASKEEIPTKTAEIAEKLGVSHLLEKHPYDVSGGEAQKCALAKVLAAAPQILLLDEPTKAIDPAAKRELARIIRELCAEGTAVLAVTHDVEFAAENADRCALFFDGEILAPAAPQAFFDANNFYTTAASRISRGILENAVTEADIVRLAGGVK
ncbi:MAG: energy-coupling factor ABC transporter ATP-binding protein [Clostridia bacterium]|nr:energy-coupling factor ABC transporter ATP-binding protein [Clostridia bacterium]